MASSAPEPVNVVIAILGHERGVDAPRYPAARTLEISAEKRLKIARALNRHVRAINRRLRLQRFKLRCLKLLYEAKAAMAEPVRNLNRLLG